MPFLSSVNFGALYPDIERRMREIKHRIRSREDQLPLAVEDKPLHTDSASVAANSYKDASHSKVASCFVDFTSSCIKMLDRKGYSNVKDWVKVGHRQYIGYCD